MPYPIRIGVTTTGELIVGSMEVKSAQATGDLSDMEVVYGSQIPHRVAAFVGGKWKIMTPTMAKRLNAKETKPFPRPPPKRFPTR